MIFSDSQLLENPKLLLHLCEQMYRGVFISGNTA